MTTPSEDLTEESASSNELAASARRIRVGGGWAILGRIGIALFGFLVSALLARLLDPGEMGAYFLALSLVTAGALLGQMGLDRTAVRLVAESMGVKDPGCAYITIKKVLAWGGIGSVCVAAILFLGVGRWIAVDVFKESSLTGPLWWICVWVVVLAMESLLASIFRGFHDIRLAVTFSGLARSALLTITFVCLWLYRGYSSLSEIIMLTALVGGISTAIAFLLLHNKTRDFIRESDSEPTKMLVIALPLLVHALLLYVVSQASVWILGIYSTNEDVAIYGTAMRLVLLVGLSTTVVNSVVPPLIAEKHAQGKIRSLQNLLRSATTVCGLPAVVVLTAYIFWGEWILGVVFGGFYKEAAVILIILSVAEIVNVLTGPCSVSLVMTGHQLSLMMLTILRAVLNVVGSVLVVKTYGVVGVAVVYAVLLVIYNIASLLAAKMLLGIWTHAGLSTVRHMFVK